MFMAGASFVGGVGYLYVFISEFCDSEGTKDAKNDLGFYS